MRRLLTSALAVLATTALPACANAQFFEGTPKAARSSEPNIESAVSEIQTDIQRRIDSTRAQAQELVTTMVPGDEPQNEAAPAPQPAPQPQANVLDCSNCVALTFDDGPSPYTNQLLDTFKAKNAHASFMVLADLAYQYPQALQRMQAEGHTIGNHTKTHRQLNQLAYGDIAQEIDAGNAAIRNATGQNPQWLRPPYGATNETVDQVVRDKGLSQALWNVDTLDWKIRDSQHVCNAAVQDANPGSIVLMHDIHPTTVNAAECIIDGLRAKGLEPVSLDELLPTPENGMRYYSR
ncbi:polysaccharide deacetylase family protein [Corynebacterium macginleyi]|uniref:polysaccharide deacetylase family protein n=1 Tax=Corynebacterium macginleyi TaxID=38290 RepID=UPI00307FD12E